MAARHSITQICDNLTNHPLLGYLGCFQFSPSGCFQFFPFGNYSLMILSSSMASVYTHLCDLYFLRTDSLRKGRGGSKDIHIFKAFVQLPKLLPEMLFTCISKWYMRVSCQHWALDEKHLIVLNLHFFSYSKLTTFHTLFGFMLWATLSLPQNWERICF